MSGDITGEFNLSDDARSLMAEEVNKKLAPLIGQMAELQKQMVPMVAIVDQNQHRLVSVVKAVDEIKKQNVDQIATLKAQDEQMKKFDYWRTSYFGNGSGIQGAWELARKEDKEWRATISSEISGFKQDKFRQEGKTELLQDQETKRLKHAERADSHTTHLWTRYRTAVDIAAILFGSWLWSLVHPLARLLVNDLLRALQ